MKKFLIVFIFVSLILNSTCYANWFSEMARALKDTNKINTGILNSQVGLLNLERDLLASQHDMEGLMKEVNGSLTGHAGWGTYNVHDYHSYGEGANKWASVLQMAGKGSGSGALGQTLNSLFPEFPINTNNFNGGISNPVTQKYYALKSQTVLATRAASQLDYDKIQDQTAYQHMLQQQIEKTKDLKGAVDLNNRIQVEANLINLEILRQSALANQERSITEQATLNSALQNAQFLSTNER